MSETRHRTGRRHSYSALARMFGLFVMFPTLVGTIYFGFIASDRYVAEARYAIRTGTQAPSGFMANVLGAGALGGTAHEDAGIVRDYIFSRDMLEQLYKRMDVKAHYSDPNVDWLSRLKSDASEEYFLEYFEDRVDIIIDVQSNISTLRVHAFDPLTATVLAGHLLELSEQLVNDMSERITEDTLRFARRDLDRTEKRVLATMTSLTLFRKSSRSIDPGQETGAVLSIITDLETKLAGVRADLIEAKSYMRDDSAQVRNLKAREVALKSQVTNERDRLTNGHSSDLTSLIDRYQPLVLEQELAKQRYASALTSLEAARAEAQGKQRYLIAFVSPQLPTEATEPKRGWMIATVFAFSFVIFGIGGLIWSAIKDHIGV